ncbi:MULTISPECIES: putative sporulation protein YtxC [unclassified Paenibacillus]|uniref:putative sporulation protein YtxC n=1 Tax=unclassified Paenibacillus TaxID=185978 RepID=UPI00020D7FA4|nr:MULTISPECIES: putative sporulation protein YtxC [unclassified Paenibacillus]EGL15466.1 putative sporulation protein YtxC [Paenibacillus sp. HGF7]EPD82869.1 hypothetical protein HMPREF1207_03661 [Paenibacillus sp. HGH0039]
MSFVQFVFNNSAVFDISALQSRIESRLALLNQEGNPVRVVRDTLEQCTMLRIEGTIGGKKHQPKPESVIEAAAAAAAEQIVEGEEERLIRKLLVNTFHYKDPEEAAKIGRYCRQFLNGEEEGESAAGEYGLDDYLDWGPIDGMKLRAGKISEPLKALLQEGQRVNLPGFITFRLQEYMDELKEVVEYAIDEYVMDQQYQEFISLLQYFVYIQETKTAAAHLIHKEGAEFTILDEHMQPIDTSKMEASFTLEMIEKDISFEDMIVSTLISVSPATIYIHTREPDLPVIRTIMQIFESRATICSYCGICRTKLAGNSDSGSPSPLT